MPSSSWDITNLGSLAHVEMGQSPPSEFVSESEGSGVPFLQGNAEFSALHPVPRLWCRKPPKMCKGGDSLISVRAPVGAINRADRDYCIGRGLAAVRFTGADPDFGYHGLGYFSTALRRVAQGTTFEAVGGTDLRSLSFPCCARTEQRRIAAILDTLDDAIRRTEQVIGKLQQMKQGLLHDLLTRGVDENGDLRPPPSEAPHLYEDSPLGRIPRGWAATELGMVASWLSGGTPSKSNPKFWRGTIPWVSPKDMKRFVLDDTEDHVTQLGASAGTGTAPAGSVFVVVRGMILAHTFPVCVAAREMAFNQDVKAVVPRPGVDGRYLAYWFVGNASALLRLVTEATHGTKRIDLKGLKESPLALPKTAEAEAIAAKLAGQDAAVGVHNCELAKLRTLKHGLLHDLLMGRVRVPLPPEVTA